MNQKDRRFQKGGVLGPGKKQDSAIVSEKSKYIAKEKKKAKKNKRNYKLQKNINVKFIQENHDPTTKRTKCGQEFQPFWSVIKQTLFDWVRNTSIL